MKSYKFIIIGKVQGVYYRKTIKENATKSKFSGYVKNLPNGNVEAVVTCDKEELNSFIVILKKGSQYSKVTNIIQLSTNEIYSHGFRVKY